MFFFSFFLPSFSPTKNVCVCVCVRAGLYKKKENSIQMFSWGGNKEEVIGENSIYFDVWFGWGSYVLCVQYIRVCTYVYMYALNTHTHTRPHHQDFSFRTPYDTYMSRNNNQTNK